MPPPHTRAHHVANPAPPPTGDAGDEITAARIERLAEYQQQQISPAESFVLLANKEFAAATLAYDHAAEMMYERDVEAEIKRLEKVRKEPTYD